MKRYWDKVNKEGDCWEWQGAKTNNGYGLFWINGGLIVAHRYALIGDKKGGVVMHHCDNRLCCNPDHLEHATQSKNMKDAWKKGRMRVGRRYCPDEIRSYHRQGCTPRDIATFMGCTRQTVYLAISP